MLVMVLLSGDITWTLLMGKIRLGPSLV